MNGRKAKQLRRENPEPKVPQLTEPFMVEIKGKMTHVPRRERRAVYRRYIKMLKTGQITFQDLIDRQKNYGKEQTVVEIPEGAIDDNWNAR